MRALARYATTNVTVRAMRSTLVSAVEFDALARAPSLGAAWNFLKKTAFGAALPDVDWNRSQDAEQYIRHASAIQFQRSVRHLRGRPATVATMLLSRWDLDNLQTALRAWHGHDAEHGAHSPPGCYVHQIAFDHIAESNTIVEVAAALHGTPYAAPIIAASAEYEKAQSTFAIELTLEKDFYARLIDATAALGGADARDGLAILGAEIDLMNLAWIGRMLRAPQAPGIDVSNAVIPGPSKFSRSLAACGTSRDRLAQVSDDYVGRLMPHHDDMPSDVQHLALLEYAVADAAAALAQRQFERFPFRIACIYAFYLLTRLEMKNLIAVFAGKAAEMNESDIRKRLFAVR